MTNKVATIEVDEFVLLDKTKQWIRNQGLDFIEWQNIKFYGSIDDIYILFSELEKLIKKHIVKNKVENIVNIITDKNPYISKTSPAFTEIEAIKYLAHMYPEECEFMICLLRKIRVNYAENFQDQTIATQKELNNMKNKFNLMEQNYYKLTQENEQLVNKNLLIHKKHLNEISNLKNTINILENEKSSILGTVNSFQKTLTNLKEQKQKLQDGLKSQIEQNKIYQQEIDNFKDMTSFVEQENSCYKNQIKEMISDLENYKNMNNIHQIMEQESKEKIEQLKKEIAELEDYVVVKVE